jgi:hypothetical protein
LPTAGRTRAAAPCDRGNKGFERSAGLRPPALRNRDAFSEKEVVSSPYPQVQDVCELTQRKPTLTVRGQGVALRQLKESNVNELTDGCRTVLAPIPSESVDALQEIRVESCIDSYGSRHRN